MLLYRYIFKNKQKMSFPRTQRKAVCNGKRSEKQRRKGKIYPFECRVPKNSKER